MDAGWYEYLTRLHAFVEQQGKKISRLEAVVQTMQQELEKLKERPPVQIGNIEYKFDQLKVETLEGTLNIGLNPTDLQEIDDFTVDQQTMNVPSSPKQILKRTIALETEIQQYLESQLESIYRGAQEELGVQVDDSYFTFIKEDIKKQLSSRIAAHLKEQNSAGIREEASEEADGQIIELLKQEIQNGVYLFLKNLPENMKEGRTE